MDNYTYRDTEEKRHRKKTTLDPCVCPICGLSLRENELEIHYKNELEKLTKIKKVSKSPQTSPSTSKTRDGENGAGSSKGDSGENCWGTYQKIKENRVRRTSKLKNRKRKIEDKSCPICFKMIVNEDLQVHVELCLKKQDNRSISDESDDEIDVGETYSWCGQTRIRATSLLEGNLSTAGIGTCISKSNENEDELVNIDGDDDTYGQNQYSERDIILLNKEDERLHDLVVTGTSESPSTSTATLARENNQNVANSVSSSPTNFLDKMDVDCDKTEINSNSDNQHSNPQVIIECLKAKIREYENFIKNRPKCMICLSPEFEKPVVSVSCWHVYCEKCWLATLGAKKLCPQCSMITAASDLRRIYL